MGNDNFASNTLQPRWGPTYVKDEERIMVVRHYLWCSNTFV